MVKAGLLKTLFSRLWGEQIQTLRKMNPKVQILANPGVASEGAPGIGIGEF